MPETTKLSIPLIAGDQAQKHVTVNEALTRIDALTQLRIEGTAVITPPTAASDGAVYDVGPGATGAWSGEDGRLAVFQNGGWAFVSPGVGWEAYLEDLGSRAVYSGQAWVPGGGSISPSGAGFVHRSIEFDVAVTSGAVSGTSAVLPAMGITYGLTGRVIEPIGGAPSFAVGVSSDTQRYGSGIGTGAGSWLRGITGQPQTYYVDTPLVLSAEGGGSFDGTGRVLLAVHFAELTLPGA